MTLRWALAFRKTSLATATHICLSITGSTAAKPATATAEISAAGTSTAAHILRTWIYRRWLELMYTSAGCILKMPGGVGSTISGWDTSKIPNGMDSSQRLLRSSGTGKLHRITGFRRRHRWAMENFHLTPPPREWRRCAMLMPQHGYAFTETSRPQALRR